MIPSRDIAPAPSLARVIHADSLVAMRLMLSDSSVDAIVTDPPYGLSFMGKRWDYDVPSTEMWAECLRVLKPGGHLLAFAGTRTQHRMAVRIEDAGFEIRDMIAWVYSTGFPKSHNLDGDRQGWGTALKPAMEPITVARKPLIGTMAQNVAAHGTGPLNIDGCRVPTDDNLNGGAYAKVGGRTESQSLRAGSGMNVPGKMTGKEFVPPPGRWPANLIHDGDDEVTGLFPDTTSGSRAAGVRKGMGFGSTARGDGSPAIIGSSGNAARFFLQVTEDDDEWLARNLHLSDALFAASNLSLQKASESIALAVAASAGLPAAMRFAVHKTHSTTATARELRLLAESVMQAILNIGPEFLREWQHIKLSPESSPVNVVAIRERTGITTITASHWRSDGSAEPATFSITSENSDHGEAGSRFKYCAKASKADRDHGLTNPEKPFVQFQTANGTSGKPSSISEGRNTAYRNHHPTVKPTELMRYLCRLITPPGGLVLDPFCGSGSTGRGAVMEGFSFLGIEKEAEFIDIARARIAAVHP